MHTLKHTIEEVKLFEAIADISFLAGQKGFFSGDSRTDIAEFITWAKEFEALNEETNWDEEDYCDAIERFTLNKLRVDVQIAG
jgi:hypothetical protein